jgi:5-methylcytosine-specific restriction endonuclease McrA
MKPCSKCGEMKLLSEYGKDKSVKSGLHSQCKSCRNAMMRGVRLEKKTKNPSLWQKIQHAWQERKMARPDWREYQRKGYKKYRDTNLEKERQRVVIKDQNREAAKRNGGTITEKEWSDLKKKYDYTCLCCGRREPEIKLTLDHVKPLAKPHNGINIITNAQPLCGSCNFSKGAKWIDYR